MKTNIITEAEREAAAISSLPTRPTAPKSFGGKGFTATEMKAAFDALPTLVLNRLNSLIAELSEEDIAMMIPSGIHDGHTLRSLLMDITSGEIGNYLVLGGDLLYNVIDRINQRIDLIAAAVGINPSEV